MRRILPILGTGIALGAAVIFGIANYVGPTSSNTFAMTASTDAHPTAIEASTAAPEESSARTESPLPSVEPATARTALPTATPTPLPDALFTPRPLPTAHRESTAPINLLAWSQGAIVRAWSARSLPRYPIELLLTPNSHGWSAQPHERGPYEFVFEFPSETTIVTFAVDGQARRGGPYPGPGSPAPASPAAVLHISVSNRSAETGFTDVAAVSFGESGALAREQTIVPASPVVARWVKLHVDAPAVSVDHGLAIRTFAAFGTQRPLAPPRLDGPWFLLQGDFGNPAVFDSVRGRFRDRLARPFETERFNTRTFGTYAQFAQCNKAGAGAVFAALLGSNHMLTHHPGPNEPGEGTLVGTEHSGMLVGASEGGYPFLLFRQPGERQCRSLGPTGSGAHSIVVLWDNPGGAAYAPMSDPATFARYRYLPVFAPLFQPSVLGNAESVVISMACSIGLELLPWQAQALRDFVKRGHKLIIHDADSCMDSYNYSFLPFPLVLSTTGAHGHRSNGFRLIESDPLGGDTKDEAHYADTDAFVKDARQQLGDSNVIVNDDPHWCGHLLTTNAKGVSGFVQAYARYGAGLIVYDGLDKDNREVPQFRQLLRYELALPVRAKLPCTRAGGGFLLLSPNARREYVSGKAQRISAGLDAYAIQKYAGNVRLSVDGPFPATLSSRNVALHANVVPFALLIAVPKASRGTYRFRVRGDDIAGHTSQADVELAVGVVSPVERALGQSGHFTLHDILFDTASAKIRPESYAAMSALADALNHNPMWKLSIAGYTDNIGGADYNLGLSKRRAASVKSALILVFHIESRRLRTTGFGLKHPIASNAGESGRQLNRRVELVRTW